MPYESTERARPTPIVVILGSLESPSGVDFRVLSASGSMDSSPWNAGPRQTRDPWISAVGEPKFIGFKALRCGSVHKLPDFDSQFAGRMAPKYSGREHNVPD